MRLDKELEPHGQIRLRMRMALRGQDLIKKHTCHVLVFCVLLVGLIPGAVGAQNEGPELMIDRTTFDFGQVDHGQIIEHVFTVRNSGQTDLVITEIVSSCGCLQVAKYKQVIPPHGQGKIKAVLDTEGEQGQLNKHIFISTNEGKKGEHKLTMRGEVVHPVSFRPAMIDFGRLKTGEAKSLQVKAISREEKNLEIIELDTSAHFLDARVLGPKDQASMTEGKVVFEISLTDKAPAGKFVEQVAVQTNLTGNVQNSLYVYGEIIGPIKVDPEMITFSPGINDGESPFIDLSSRDDTRFQVTKVKTDVPELTPVLEAVEKDRHYRIHFEIPETDEPQNVSGVVRIRTNSDQQSEIVVQVFGMIGNFHDLEKEDNDPGVEAVW